MSIALQMQVERLLERVNYLEDLIKKGLESEGEERLKALENKYHMLNARLGKKVD
jgi:hypothetical protein